MIQSSIAVILYQEIGSSILITADSTEYTIDTTTLYTVDNDNTTT